MLSAPPQVFQWIDAAEEELRWEDRRGKRRELGASRPLGMVDIAFNLLGPDKSSQEKGHGLGQSRLDVRFYVTNILTTRLVPSAGWEKAFRLEQEESEKQEYIRSLRWVIIQEGDCRLRPRPEYSEDRSIHGCTTYPRSVVKYETSGNGSECVTLNDVKSIKQHLSICLLRSRVLPLHLLTFPSGEDGGGESPSCGASTDACHFLPPERDAHPPRLNSIRLGVK